MALCWIKCASCQHPLVVFIKLDTSRGIEIQTNSLKTFKNMIYLHWCILDKLLLALSAVFSILILTLLASAKFSDFLLLMPPPPPPPEVGSLIPFLLRISIT